MLKKLAQHAAVVTLYCTGIVIGVAAGIWIGAESPWPDLAALLGALAGAFITVMGAFWVSDHRADAERDRLRNILLDGVKRLRARAEQPAAKGGTEARQRAREVFSRWQYLAAFSPYRELGSFGHIQAMAEIDVCCRQLETYTHDPQSTPPAFTGSTETYITQMHRGYTGAILAQAVQAICDEVTRRCQEAEEALSKRGTVLAVSQREA
ncbi:MAG TPA: hypothetical protein VM512_02895 [Burkholderiaceae bacterium]|nr:hypothetical protein [Burkholderiaceae bacterium]